MKNISKTTLSKNPQVKVHQPYAIFVVEEDTLVVLVLLEMDPKRHQLLSQRRLGLKNQRSPITWASPKGPGPGARGLIWARLGPMGFSPAEAQEAQARPKPFKGRAGPRASFQARPGLAGWPESWAFRPAQKLTQRPAQKPF